mgnify:CR=1 FL=1
MNNIERIVNIIKEKIKSNPIILFNCFFTEKMLYELLVEEAIDERIFYYMMFLYDFGYVSDVIFKNKDIAINNIKNKNNESQLPIQEINYWNLILSDEIIKCIKETHFNERKLNENVGKIIFLNEPSFNDSNYSGVDGEYEIYKELKTFNDQKYNDFLYANYRVKIHNKDYESDFIIVSNNVIIIIEVKNWHGEITIDKYGNITTNGSLGYKNPISQNNRHVNDLRTFLINKFDIDIPIKSVIVFGKKSHVINIDKEYNRDTEIINYDELNYFIQKTIHNDENKKIFDNKIISSFINVYNSFDNTNYIFYPEDFINLELANEYYKYQEVVKDSNYKKGKKIFHYSIDSTNRQLENDMNTIYFDKIIKYNIRFNDDIKYNCFIINSFLKFNVKCRFKYANLIAVIYNYLLRNNEIDSSLDIPLFINHYDYNNITDIREQYPKIFKLMIVILLLIKNNYFTLNEMNIEIPFFIEDKYESLLTIAIKCLNNYLEKISLLTIGKILKLKIQDDESYEVGFEKDSNLDIMILDYNNKKFSQEIEENSLWIEDNIRYNINDKNDYILIDFLKEFTPFTAFKEGQLDFIKNILNFPTNKIVIMPTGSGKSLIYYFCAILQPKVTFIVSPNDILISNQINNLKKIHRYTNVVKLSYKTKIGLNQIIYSTPIILQEDSLIRDIIDCDNIYSFVLDEVHCLSFLSHNFRPEYFTLSSKLNMFFKKTLSLGFTATSDYEVTKDLAKQLTINFSEQDILENINMRTDRLSYDIRCYDTREEQLIALFELSKRISVLKNIVFVKDEKTANEIFKIIGTNKSLIFSQDDQGVLDLFIDLNSGFNFLICGYELGIGLDLGNISNVIHFGIPYSKMDYVQQIGRAGRNGEYCKSYVLYLNQQKFESYLFDRNLEYDSFISKLIADEKNDYTMSYLNIFKKFLNYNKQKKEFKNILLQVMEDYFNRGFTTTILTENNDFCFYILQALGIISYWGKNKNQVVLCLNKLNNISLIKNNFRTYMSIIGNNDMNEKISYCNDMTKLALLFYDVFVENYIISKRNQVFELLEMLERYKDQMNVSNEINSEIENFFALPFMRVSKCENWIRKVPLMDINSNILSFNSDDIDNIINVVDLINYATPSVYYLKLLREYVNNSEIKDFTNKIEQICNKLDSYNIFNLFISFGDVLKKLSSNEKKNFDNYLLQVLSMMSNLISIDNFNVMSKKYINNLSIESNKYYALAIYFDEYIKKMRKDKNG